jgi:hypothetical protein
MWVIKRSVQDGGGYVARPGSRGSYAMELQAARVYSTQEMAERDMCPENERAIRVDDEMTERGF